MAVRIFKGKVMLICCVSKEVLSFRNILFKKKQKLILLFNNIDSLKFI